MAAELREPDVLMPDVLISDVALRDGLQDEDVVVPTAAKLGLAHGLLAAGVRSLEVGSFVHPDRVPQMADTDRLLHALSNGVATGATLHTLVFNDRGARRAIAAGARSVRVVVSAGDGHSRANAGVGTVEALDRLQSSIAILHDGGVAVEACIATAFVCPFDGDIPPGTVAHLATRLAAMGAGVVHLADTVGAAHPSQIGRTVATVRDACPDLPLGLHLHNSYGMASAAAWTALQLGVRRFDAALGGLGGCPFAPGASGNVATDDLVHLLHREGLDTGIDSQLLADVRDHLRTAVGHELASALARVPAPPAQRPRPAAQG
ncbi:hydroxymethylglutaryl-CoA lyase [Pseudonocardia sp. CA-107938]|uniref:hydroxymethylglutaryl-CoA lyase n=1 Tax=Pseudonocardia sp. CA-107938 TaxID=3240021 RepID=UPI003D8AEB10